MSFAARSFNTKKLVRQLGKLPALSACSTGRREKGEADISLLSAYVYENLFVPIVLYEHIPVKGLDMGEVSHDDLNMLYEVLSQCQVFPLLGLGLRFGRMDPATVAKATFI